MTPHLDQLDDTFSAHEPLAPDAASVLARSHAIARNLKRRQWAVRATTGGALAAGLIAGGIAIPQALHHHTHEAVVETADGTGTAAPQSTPTPSSKYTLDQEYEAYFDAGYDYNDALQLAEAWNQVGAQYIGKVKAEAGGKLLDGQTLPVAPSGAPVSADDRATQAFFNAGYDYQDAQQLGQIWHETNINQIKSEAGQKIENGQTLPIQPSGGTTIDPATVAQDNAVAAFFDAGYTYDDAVTLSQTWNTADPYHAKIEGGQKIEQGQTLPIPPSGTPASADNKAIDAFFAAGYDYQDAQQLAQMWHQTDIGQVKAEAGQKLENGQTLPIQPSS